MRACDKSRSWSVLLASCVQEATLIGERKKASLTYQGSHLSHMKRGYPVAVQLFLFGFIVAVCYRISTHTQLCFGL